MIIMWSESPPNQLDFHLNDFDNQKKDQLISVLLTIEFEDYSFNGSIKYHNVHYSDPTLIKPIEVNLRVMKNIYSHLWNLNTDSN